MTYGYVVLAIFVVDCRELQNYSYEEYLYYRGRSNEYGTYGTYGTIYLRRVAYIYYIDSSYTCRLVDYLTSLHKNIKTQYGSQLCIICNFTVHRVICYKVKVWHWLYYDVKEEHGDGKGKYSKAHETHLTI